ncbi:prepilin-type N-terminal cleavage/methylation domain-containing protein [Planococcus beigongshangi]|uniref:prepilin-type N-terminal cleavage/methylation domain-containing protein n=1 Tax=Planococcus beigongshangi TaxID=2782536 RepID=UPI00193C5E9F|nr:prepilin-type N-terminal cleavage/methylation domain-containing protein [Planococcus beigongshangi]
MYKQKGMTLLEVLAALVLVSIVMTLLIGIIINSQNNFNRQEATNLNTVDITLLLNKITSEIRKNPDAVLATTHELKIATETASPIIYTFDKENNILLRNGLTIASELSDFKIDPEELEDDILNLAITDSKLKVWEIKVVLRRGTE